MVAKKGGGGTSNEVASVLGGGGEGRVFEHRTAGWRRVGVAGVAGWALPERWE